MRLIRTSAAFAMMLFAAPVFASMGGSSTPEPKQPPSTPVDASASTKTTPRQDAERYYGDAYSEIAKAKKDVADKKDKNAQKRFKKALERAERAVEIDSTYHEAWNLVGYASRKLQKHDQALAAYNKCLAIEPNYAPAREYLGEALLELGKPDQAREQLALLQKLDAKGEVAELEAAIGVYAQAHPEGATGASAPADSSATK